MGGTPNRARRPEWRGTNSAERCSEVVPVAGFVAWFFACLGAVSMSCTPPTPHPGRPHLELGGLRPREVEPHVIRPADFGSSTIDPTLLVRPDPRRTWSGVVITIANVPALSWTVDDVLIEANLPANGYPMVALDTRTLSNGRHVLGVEIEVGLTGRTALRRTGFSVWNPTFVRPTGLGTFVDATSVAGMDELVHEGHSPTENRFPGAVAADFNQDGRADIFAWLAGTTVFFFQDAPWSFHRQDGPALADMSTAGVADLDGDGDPDLVVAGRGLHVFRNDRGAFTEVTALVGVPASVASATNYRGLTFADLDGDGLTDILVGQMDCSGGPSAVLHAEGSMHYVDLAETLALAAPEGATYGFAVDPVDEGGALQIWAFREGCTRVPTQHLAILPGATGTTDLEPELPLPASPMGSSWLDVDDDGALELWLSGDTVSGAWRGGWSTDDVAPYAGLDSFFGNGQTPVAGWSQVLLDVDADGRLDVFVPHDRSDPTLDGAGARHALFRHDPSGPFTDIAEQLGLGATASCRSAFGADLDDDGDLDLLTGCTDGVHVLRNDVMTVGALATLHLRGTLSTADGLHARVRSLATGQTQIVRGGGETFANGVTAVPVRRVDAPFEVLWPSGLTQEVPAEDGSAWSAAEPPVARVTPRRVLPGAAVEVEVNPSLAGAPGSAVTVEVEGGSITWATPLTLAPDGYWRGTLTVPSTPTTLVLTLRVGTRALGIHPTLYVRP